MSEDVTVAERDEYLDNIRTALEAQHEKIVKEIYGPGQDDPDLEEEGDLEPYEDPRHYDCQVKVLLLRKNAEMPRYAHPGDAGADLIYCPDGSPDDDIVLSPLGRVLVPTGLAFEIPVGYEIQIRARSGTSHKTGLAVINAPGTIDAGFRGEVMLSIVNLSTQKQFITPGMKLAQMVVNKLPSVQLIQATSLSDTERGAGGFGSTGS